jgi:hypothetical protein
MSTSKRQGRDLNAAAALRLVRQNPVQDRPAAERTTDLIRKVHSGFQRDLANALAGEIFEASDGVQEKGDPHDPLLGEPR